METEFSFLLLGFKSDLRSFSLLVKEKKHNRLQSLSVRDVHTAPFYLSNHQANGTKLWP